MMDTLGIGQKFNLNDLCGNPTKGLRTRSTRTDCRGSSNSNFTSTSSDNGPHANDPMWINKINGIISKYSSHILQLEQTAALADQNA